MLNRWANFCLFYFYLLGKMHANIMVVLLASILYYVRQNLFKGSAITQIFNKYFLSSELNFEHKHKMKM